MTVWCIMSCRLVCAGTQMNWMSSIILTYFMDTGSLIHPETCHILAKLPGQLKKINLSGLSPVWGTLRTYQSHRYREVGGAEPFSHTACSCFFQNLENLEVVGSWQHNWACDQKPGCKETQIIHQVRFCILIQWDRGLGEGILLNEPEDCESLKYVPIGIRGESFLNIRDFKNYCVSQISI